jgi:cysteine desulfurase family protein
MQEIIYLDNAATSFPKPGIVHDTVRDFYSTRGVNPGRTGCDLAIEAGDMIEGARQHLANLFNPSLVAAGTPPPPERLVFTLNATMSLNLVINGVVGPGDHIVTSMVEHNSVIRPVNHKVRDEGCEATYVVPDPEGYLDPEEIRRAIRPTTKLVIVNHGSNVSGVVQDIPAIGAVCRAAGVPLAIDVAQTAGVIDIDMAAWHVSFACFTGHKALYGPTGTGGIYVAEGAEIRSTITGGTGVRSAVPYHLEEYPWRLEAGTLNLAGIAGLAAGLGWVKDQGMHVIHTRELELLGMLQEGLQGVRGVHLFGTRSLERRVPTLSATVDSYDPSDIGALLDVEYGIQTRTGLHCAPRIHEHYGTAPRGSVRFSIGPFTTPEHIEAAITAVREISATRN